MKTIIGIIAFVGMFLCFFLIGRLHRRKHEPNSN